MDAMGNPKMPTFPSKIGFFLVVGIPINANKSQETWHWGRHIQRWMGFPGSSDDTNRIQCNIKGKSLNITNISIPGGSTYDIFIYVHLVDSYSKCR